MKKGMKKTFIILALMVCATAAFSQEAVGRIIAQERDIEIEADFYENSVTVETVVEIIKTRLVSTQSKGLRSVDDELSDSLMEELQKRISAVNFSEMGLAWGYVTEYCAIKFSFIYKKKNYFVIAIMPEENYWFFEDEAK